MELIYCQAGLLKLFTDSRFCFVFFVFFLPVSPGSSSWLPGETLDNQRKFKTKLKPKLSLLYKKIEGQLLIITEML